MIESRSLDLRCGDANYRNAGSLKWSQHFSIDLETGLIIADRIVAPKVPLEFFEGYRPGL